MPVDPNPQGWNFAAGESPRLKVNMTPAEDITGQTFTLTVRNPANEVLLTVTSFTAVTLSTGVFYFTLTAAQTGTTLGPGDYLYDVWRTNPGSEKRLVYGVLSVDAEQLSI